MTEVTRVVRAGQLLVVASLAFATPASATEGRWASNDNVAMAHTKAGSKFFLDVVVAGDGSFKGTWEEYVCFNYTGAYGIVTVSCQRSRKPSSATGRLDRRAGTGTMNLSRLGKSSFKFKTATTRKGELQLDIELPREWLKQGAPVLYETSLNPKAK